MLSVTHFVEGSNNHVNASTYSIYGGPDSRCLTASSTEKPVELTLPEGAVSRKLQIWELISPTPSIPTGWFRIRNTATNATLAHRFVHIPPFLIPDNAHQTAAPCNMNCCNGSCDKAAQWALVHGQIYAEYLSKEDSTRNRYLLTNRLTGGFLADCGGSGGLTHVSCWSKTPTEWIESSLVHNSLWEVQVMAPPHIWEFRNKVTRRVLSEIANNQYVSCVERSGGDPQACSQWRVESVSPIFITCLEYLSIAY